MREPTPLSVTLDRSGKLPLLVESARSINHVSARTYSAGARTCSPGPPLLGLNRQAVVSCGSHLHKFTQIFFSAQLLHFVCRSCPKKFSANPSILCIHWDFLLMITTPANFLRHGAFNAVSLKFTPFMAYTVPQTVIINQHPSCLPNFVKNCALTPFMPRVLCHADNMRTVCDLELLCTTYQ